jgi:hypothetical protein
VIKAKAGAEILEVVAGLRDKKDEKADKRLPVTLNKHLKPA